MSIKVMAHIWERAKVSGSQLLVLLAMADFADDQGRNIYPSMTTLAQKARLSESQARRVVHELVESGIVEVMEAGGWDGKRNRSNEYRIVMDDEDLGGDGGGSRMTPQSTHHRAYGGSADAPRGGSVSASTVVAPALDDPLSDPSVDPPLKKKANNNMRALNELVLAEAEKAVVVVGADALIREMDFDQKMALLSWLWLYNDWFEEDLDYRDKFRRSYGKRDPFAGMDNIAGVMVSQAKARRQAPLTIADREDMLERLAEMEQPQP
jgi:hypothetical protein